MKRSVLLLAILFFVLQSYAQTFTLTGTVIDDRGDPLPGITIMIKGTRTGTVTNNSGEFRILVKHKDLLVITGVGLEPAEKLIIDQRPITITLKRSVMLGTEVVVTALGITKQSKMLSYSTTRISYDEINSNQRLKTWKRSGELDENSVRLSIGDKEFLPLKTVQVAVVVDGFRARVLFDYFFYSNKPGQLRGDFKLKLPYGASPCYFAFGSVVYLNKDMAKVPATFVNYPMNSKLYLSNDTIRRQRTDINQDLKEAYVVPKEKAAYAYNEVVRGRIDPALAEWAGADIFSCSVFPLTPDKLHRIVIGYDINLSELNMDGSFSLNLPYENIPRKLDIDIATAPGFTHQITPAIPNRLTAAGRIKYHLENFKPKEFEISTRSAKPVFLDNEGAEHYFGVTYNPELPRNMASAGSDKAIFLLDVSLSSQPDKFNLWLKMVETLLNNNRHTIKKFAVLCFNTSAGWWRNYYSPNNQSSVGDFLEYADRLSLIGATDLGLAIREGSNPKWLKLNEAKTIFLLSDGDASWGEDNLYQLSKNIYTADKVYAFTTGISGTDTRTLDHLCRQSNGAVFSVLNEEEAEKVSQAIRYQPWRIKTVSTNKGHDILIAGRPFNIFPGQKLLFTGRGQIQKGDLLTLELEQDGKPVSIRIPAELIITSELAKRVYGQTAVTQLEDFSFLAEAAAQKYANYYSVAGQTSSWLMLESNQLYARYNISPVDNIDFIKKNPVTSIIGKIQENEKEGMNLSSAKATMKAWLNKMQREELLFFEPDSVFQAYFDKLPESSFEINVPAIDGDLKFRDQWHRLTNGALEKQNLDYDKIMRAVQIEKSIEGKDDAFKLLSSFAENNRGDMTLLRDIAFQLSSWGLDGKAYELCRRILHSRPAEPPTYKQIASSLLKLNKADLALLYYDIAYLTDWDSRFSGFEMINAIEYCRLLNEIVKGKYVVSNIDFVKSRLKTVTAFLEQNKLASAEADLMIVITWNTDNTDIDLHLREPNNQVCYYGYKRTSNGGILTNDAIEGFGPETYIIEKAPSGTYSLDIDYFRENQTRSSAKTKIFVTAYKNWGRSNEEIIQKVIELKSSGNSVQEEEKLLKDVVRIHF